MNAIAMLSNESVVIKYYAMARRELQEHDRLEGATHADIEQLAHALKHQDFRLAIEPYMRQKAAIVGSWLSLQASPTAAEMPATLKEALANWDEMITGVAKTFGFQSEKEARDPNAKSAACG
jgi:hypothetical protein